jgi:hypothetical protein
MLILHLVRDVSPVFRFRDEVLMSGKLQYGVPTFNARLAVRTLFYQHPFNFLAISGASCANEPPLRVALLCTRTQYLLRVCRVNSWHAGIVFA